MSSHKAELDTVLNQLSELTLKFTSELESKVSEDVENFVDERQILVQKLQKIVNDQEISDLQKEELKLILAYDVKIEERMSSLKNAAQEWLLQRNVAKTQRSVYEAKYATESYLMDKRK
ncbi:hypothetical protein [Paenibacillus sp. FSL K6-0108]|uniref:hypothetical protein n=1 Tax=Paenibacillus sp. FSL K6-0108 TaxID=2921417 RepID=UPI0032454B4F